MNAPRRIAMAGDDVALFNDSLERCRRKPGFLDRFYELFVASSEEVARKFTRTDLARQKRMVSISLYQLMSFSEGFPEGEVHLHRIAKLHSRDAAGIEPRLYDSWLDCLIRAVGEYDPDFSPDVERIWRTILGRGIAVMKAQY
jgi:truncated hemoglobin YjbI